MTLSRYIPMTDRAIDVPVLMVYGLVGRQTMADLQEDRSLVRNLLNAGRGRLRRRLGQPALAPTAGSTLDDYIDGYIERLRRLHLQAEGIDTGQRARHLRRRRIHALPMPRCIREKVKNLAITITPVDFHADTEETRLERGFINVWTRSLGREDVDRVVEAYGYLPGKFMGMVFSMLTPVKSLTKYNLDMLDLFDSEDKLLNFLRMEKWLADRPAPSGRGGQAVAEGSVPGEPPGEERVHARRAQGGSVEDHDAGAEHLRDRRPHHSAELLAGRWRRSSARRITRRSPVPGGHVGVFVGGKSQGDRRQTASSTG